MTATLAYLRVSTDGQSTDAQRHSIAQRFKVKVADIVKWNNIKANKYLQPGQELTLYLAS